METIFFIIVLAAIFHFIYESILLPSLRLELRYKLFKLRDKLRNLKAENPTKIDDNVFYLLEDTICTVINRMPYLNIKGKIDASKEFEHNAVFRKRVEHRKNILKECNNEDIQKIHSKIMLISFGAFCLNAGGWFFILAPLLLIALVVAFVTSSVFRFKQFLIMGIDKLTFASDNDFRKFTHA
jgi:hypothetical protein